jgi:hypothetical protein
MSAFANIAGATSATLTVNPTAENMSGDQYRAVFTNKAGSSTTTAASLVSYGQPTVSTIVPKKGQAGVCCVGIVGTNFNPVATTSVTFGVLPATFTVQLPGLIAALAPPQAAGAIVAVTVHNGPLASPLVPGDVFQYTAPAGGPMSATNALVRQDRRRVIRVRLTARQRSMFSRYMHGRKLPKVLVLHQG